MLTEGSIQYEDIKNTQEELSGLTIEYWFDYNFLTFKWWLLVGLSIIPLLVWKILLDKERARQIIMYGLLVSLASGYRIRLALPWDSGAIPLN